jgi:hypothetical protein
VLNSFKEDVRIDGKGLTKEHGMNPSWWGSKKAVMKRSPKVYDRLKEMGFADAEIAPWVARDTPSGKTDAPTAKTGAPQLKTPVSKVEVGETPSTHVPKGTVLHSAIKSSPQRDAPVFTPTHLGATSGAPRRAYKGIPEHQLKQMNEAQLSELGLVRASDDDIYIPDKGEGGRIILDPLPEAPPEQRLPDARAEHS